MSFVASANLVLSDRGTGTPKHRSRSCGALGVMIHFENARVNTSLLFSRLTQSGWLCPLNLVFAVNNKLLVHPVIQNGSAKAPSAKNAECRHLSRLRPALKSLPVHS